MTKLDQVLKIDHIDSDVEVMFDSTKIHLKLKDDSGRFDYKRMGRSNVFSL